VIAPAAAARYTVARIRHGVLHAKRFGNFQKTAQIQWNAKERSIQMLSVLFGAIDVSSYWHETRHMKPSANPFY
jgi:hypothetical protein